MGGFKVGRYVVPVWLVAIVLVSLIGSVLGYYVMNTLSAINTPSHMNAVGIPFEVKEPIEILDYPSQFSLYPGQSSVFHVTLQNNANITYSVMLDFHLNDTAYPINDIAFSNVIYTVVPGQQDLTAWLNVSSAAPAFNGQLLIGVSRIAVAQVGNPNGLVGYWKFDEGEGTIAYDSSGNGNDGTLINDPTWTTGIGGYALSFSRASSQCVIAPAIPNLDSFTVMAWVKFKSQNWENIVATRAGEPYQFDLWMGAVGHKLRLGVELSPYANQIYMWDSDPGTTMTTGVWYFVTGVFDGNNIYTYLNATLDYSKSAAGTLYQPSLRPNVAIGGAGYDINYFDGVISGVQIYNRALTPQEILAQYLSPPT